MVISEGRGIMYFLGKFPKYKCPNCNKYTISYWQKIKLMDYRYTHSCKECGGTIKLPVWHTLLYLCEIMLMIYSIVRLNLNSFQSIILGVMILIFMWFIQLPFVPIRG